jgi:hypothetical protein
VITRDDLENVVALAEAAGAVLDSDQGAVVRVRAELDSLLPPSETGGIVWAAVPVPAYVVVPDSSWTSDA